MTPTVCKEFGPVSYGYARLDAFGRIYNRVLQHIISAEALREIIVRRLPADVWAAASWDVETVLSGKDQSHLLVRSLQKLNPYLPSGASNKTAMVIRRMIIRECSSIARRLGR